jgi:hypothetical protein
MDHSGAAMRFATCLTGVLALAAAAYAQVPSQASAKRLTHQEVRQILEDREYWRQQDDRYDFIRTRANALYPGRRDTPLRDLNISDDEIREVEGIARKYLPQSFVNISPVVADCPCEEGPSCTAQVYVVATTRVSSRGLQLSRLNKRWNVSRMQQWWHRREAIVRQNTGDSMLDDYLNQKAVYELYEEFPLCAGQMVPAKKQTASTPKKQ